MLTGVLFLDTQSQLQVWYLSMIFSVCYVFTDGNTACIL